jgi:hypothetical protein
MAEKPEYSRSRSRRRTVTDQNQTEGVVNEDTPAADLMAMRDDTNNSGPRDEHLSPAFIAKKQTSSAPSKIEQHEESTSSTGVEDSSNESPTPADSQSTPKMVVEDVDTTKHRPKIGGIAMPFILKRRPDSSTSMATLTSAANVAPQKDIRTAGALESGVKGDKKGNQKAINGNAVVNGKQPVVEAGQMVGAERPALESFGTALEDLPKAS